MQKNIVLISTLFSATQMIGSERSSKIREYFGRPTSEQYSTNGTRWAISSALGHTWGKLLFNHELPLSQHTCPCRVVLHAARGVPLVAGIGFTLGLLVTPLLVAKSAPTEKVSNPT